MLRGEAFDPNLQERLRKPRPYKLVKADKQKALDAKDKAESAKARTRAGGRCEVVHIVPRPYAISDTANGEMRSGQYFVEAWCARKDTQTHHLKGGIGRRNRGDSILAQWKLRVCASCHKDITANILKPTTANADATTIRFWRSR